MCGGTSDSEQHAPVQIEALSLDAKDDTGYRSEMRGIALGPPPSPQQLMQNRKQLIRQTWALVEQEWDMHVTRTFYQRLFERHPATTAMFMGASIELQAWKLYEILRVAVMFVDNLDELLPSIEDMGIRHARVYHVKPAHYDAVTEVFIEVLNKFLDLHLQQAGVGGHVLWRMDVTAAWTWILTLIGSTMAGAADSPRHSEAAPVSSSPSHSPKPDRREDMKH